MTSPSGVSPVPTPLPARQQLEQTVIASNAAIYSASELTKTLLTSGQITPNTAVNVWAGLSSAAIMLDAAVQASKNNDPRLAESLSSLGVQALSQAKAKLQPYDGTVPSPTPAP